MHATNIVLHHHVHLVSILLSPVCVLACPGMEAVVANLLEPGDKIIVGVNGIWWVTGSAVVAPRLVQRVLGATGEDSSCQCVVGDSEAVLCQNVPARQQR
jgi:hypothetical protein